MKAHSILQANLEMSAQMLIQYLEDLSDADLLLRPTRNANHLAWQLGHLIADEREMMEAIKPGASPALPANFAQAYTRETSSIDDPKKFHTKKVYLDLFKAQRRATSQILEGFSDSDLDKPGPEDMRSMAPTIGDVMNIAGTHILMHLGQATVLRRQLGKPLLF